MICAKAGCSLKSQGERWRRLGAEEFDVSAMWNDTGIGDGRGAGSALGPSCARWRCWRCWRQPGSAKRHWRSSHCKRAGCRRQSHGPDRAKHGHLCAGGKQCRCCTGAAERSETAGFRSAWRCGSVSRGDGAACPECRAGGRACPESACTNCIEEAGQTCSGCASVDIQAAFPQNRPSRQLSRPCSVLA